MSNTLAAGTGSVLSVTTYVYQAWSDFAAAAVVPSEFIEKIIVAVIVAFIGGMAGYAGKKFCEWVIGKMKRRQK